MQLMKMLLLIIFMMLMRVLLLKAGMEGALAHRQQVRPAGSATAPVCRACLITCEHGQQGWVL